MEKEALIKETIAGQNNPAFSTMNTSKGLGGAGDSRSVDIGGMSLQQLRREDQAVIDELGDQVKTKEEEIQILWNVIKEINKVKGANINITQLQKLIHRSEINALNQSINHSETNHHMFASPGYIHQHVSTRY